ncbi:MAG: hypothetical protein ACP5D1_06285 [Bacteroidales bacterium]
MEEIVATLDDEGKLDGMLFMPEMIKYCGQSFQIAHFSWRTCIEGHGIGFRSMTGTVFLKDLRCDGSLHGGCQRGCLFFWKEEWLSDMPVDRSDNSARDDISSGRNSLQTIKEGRYICQFTELAGASSPYRPSQLIWYLRDVWHRDMSLSVFGSKMADVFINRARKFIGMEAGRLLIGNRSKTDTEDLNLQPGEWVQVKERSEIQSTLDHEGKNRGLQFSADMLPFCGGKYKVAGKVNKIIDMESGKMVNIRNTVILEDVTCQRFGCYRANLLYWREIWLRRCEAPSLGPEWVAL